VYRQKDPTFINLLDAIRSGKQTEADLARLNDRVKGNSNITQNNSIILTPTRRKALEINLERLEAIRNPGHSYKGDLEGEFREDDLPADINLTLKSGAQVMFVKNDLQKRWVNGTLGRVVSASKDVIRVQITGNGGGTFNVAKEIWESYKHKYDSMTKK